MVQPWLVIVTWYWTWIGLIVVLIKTSLIELLPDEIKGVIPVCCALVHVNIVPALTDVGT